MVQTICYRPDRYKKLYNIVMKSNLAYQREFDPSKESLKVSKPCVILSIEDYEDLMEEVEVARSVKLPKELAEAKKRIQQGKGVPLKALEKTLGKL